MRTHLVRTFMPLALTLALSGACSASSDDASAQPRTGGTTADGDTSAPDPSTSDPIVVDGFEFAVPVSVEAGATVEVRNEDGAPHTVTADDGRFDTATVAAGTAGSFVAPAEPGTYAFHCEIHPSMTGTLVVT